MFTVIIAVGRGVGWRKEKKTLTCATYFMPESPIEPCGTYSCHCILKGHILRLCTVQPKSLLRNHKYVLFIRINVVVVVTDFERGSSGQSNSFVTLCTSNKCTVSMFKLWAG